MIKLTEAKCPSCGANIEVNKDLEKSICQYCGNTILIEEAIQKVQLSGKVEVEGIVSLNNKIENAKKYIKIKEYNEANKIVNSLIEEYPFNEEVLELCLETEVKLFDFDKFDPKSSTYTCKNQWDKIINIVKLYDRFNQTSEKSLDPELKEQLDKIVEWNNDRISDEEKCNQINKLLNNYIHETNKKTSDSPNYPFQKLYWEIGLKGNLQNGKTSSITYTLNRYSETYKFKEFKFNRDSNFCIYYQSVQNVKNIFDWAATAKRYDNLDDLIDLLKNINEKTKKEKKEAEKKAKLENKIDNVHLALVIIGIIAFAIYVILQKRKYTSKNIYYSNRWSYSFLWFITYIRNYFFNH